MVLINSFFLCALLLTLCVNMGDSIWRYPGLCYAMLGVSEVCGPLDDGSVPEECHGSLRALPEVLQCMYVMKVPVYL